MAGRPDGGWLRAAPYRQFQQWCLQTYGDAGKTKTVTRRKYERIVQLLRGGEPASGDSAKFKFWVKSKGFQLATGNAVQLSLPGDTASARLYVPVKPPLGDDQVTGGPQALRQVAMVEDFFDIIYSVHVERASIGERVGRHAGQKRTYKAISETYAFLPREAVTKFLMSCSECQKRMHLNPRATEHKENERPWTLSGEIDYNLPITATYLKHLKLQSLEDGRQEDEELDSSTEELEMSVSTPTSEEPFLTSDTRRDDSSPASSPENDEDQSSDGLTECGGYTRVLDCGQGTRGNLANRSSFASGNGCEQPLNLSERTASKPARRLAVENSTVHWPQGLPCTPINTDPGHECDSSKRSPSNNLPYELHGRAEVVLEDGGSARGEEEEEEEHEEAERGSEIEGADPERLKAFNMFVRLFVDENLDRSVPISKQPKEKVQAILASCARQFPEFQERARKRIRTYLKSCRRLRRSGLELNLRSTPPHLTSAVAENMLAMACENESRHAAKRMRLELHQDEPLALDRPSSLQTADFTAASHPTFSPIAPFPSELPHVNGGFRYSQHSYGQRGSSLQSLGPPPPPPAPTQYTPANNGPTDLSMKKLTPGGGSPPSGPGKGSIAQLSPTEVSAVRQLVAGYRESAAFLLRSADELEGLILQHN